MMPKSDSSRLQDKVARLTRETEHLETFQTDADWKIKALVVFGARQDEGLGLLSHKFDALKATTNEDTGDQVGHDIDEDTAST